MARGDWDSYLWPGSEVLRNKLGIRDRAQLQRIEYGLVNVREQQIEKASLRIPRTFDAAHLKALHGHLFGDIYEWAGQYRTVDMAKGSTRFADVGMIEQYLTIASVTAKAGDWSAVTAEQFAERTATTYAYLNQGHPFREGNGRASKVWMTQLVEQSPWRLDFERVAETDWISACSRASRLQGDFVPSHGELVPVMRQMTVADAALPSTGLSPQLQQVRDVYRASYPKPLTLGKSPGPGSTTPSATPPVLPVQRRGPGYQR